MQSNINKPTNQEKEKITENISNQTDQNKQVPFHVQAVPKERLLFFEQPDYFICEKKFYNTLPKLSIPPKVLNYNINHT